MPDGPADETYEDVVHWRAESGAFSGGHLLAS